MWQAGTEMITDVYSRFNGTSAYLLLFYVALFYICYKEKENRVLLVYSSVFILAVILNPFFAAATSDLFTGGIYWRCFWLLPIVTVFAYAATSITLSVNSKKLKILAAFCCAVLIMLSGGFIFTSENYSRADNMYKLPQEAIQVCNIMNEDKGANTAKAMVDNNLVSYVRQYDASIKLAYGRYPFTIYWSHDLRSLPAENTESARSIALFAEVNREDMDIELLVDSARILNVDYYAFSTQNPIINQLIEQGMTVIGQTETYTVIKDDVAFRS